jgi:hypothetical protein
MQGTCNIYEGLPAGQKILERCFQKMVGIKVMAFSSWSYLWSTGIDSYVI